MEALDSAREQAKAISAALSQAGHTTHLGQSPARGVLQAGPSQSAASAPVSDLAERRMDYDIGRAVTYEEMIE